LWPVGTKRLLGFPQQVQGLRRWLPESVDPASPGNIYEDESPLLPDQVDVVGNFEVCPVTREKPHVMQMVCMERASHLTARPNAAASEVR